MESSRARKDWDDPVRVAEHASEHATVSSHLVVIPQEPVRVTEHATVYVTGFSHSVALYACLARTVLVKACPDSRG
ncbi:MAG: hypothetical protein ACKVUS_17770 [Saprospiraceae bacterium]